MARSISTGTTKRHGQGDHLGTGELSPIRVFALSCPPKSGVANHPDWPRDKQGGSGNDTDDT